MKITRSGVENVEINSRGGDDRLAVQGSRHEYHAEHRRRQ
jgi:hypothetical protein